MRLDPIFIPILQVDEGFSDCRYLDTEGNPTIGYGHKLEPGSRVLSITRRAAYSLLLEDIEKAEMLLEKALPWAMTLDPVRYGVLVMMTFNMGIGSIKPARGLLGFTKTLKLIKAGDYIAASAEMLKSKWAKQVKGRASRLARYMEKGDIC